MKKLVFIFSFTFILTACERNETKCDRIVDVVSLTVCNDYIRSNKNYRKASKQACFNDMKEDFMEVCREQIKYGGEPQVIKLLEDFSMIKTKD